MNSQVRPAEPRDLDQIVTLCEASSHGLESPNEAFYASGSGFADSVRKSATDCIGTDHAIAFVHENSTGIDGVVLGFLLNAPPVYDPGGKVCLVPWLVFEDSAVGSALLDSADAQSRLHGSVVLVVECRANDHSKLDLVAKEGFTVASDWYFRESSLPLPNSRFSAYDARPEDAAGVATLCETNRKRYQQYQPVFWRIAKDSMSKHSAYIKEAIEHQRMAAALVVVYQGKMFSVVMVDLRPASNVYEHRGAWCSIDDFAVESEAMWSSEGRDLLCAGVRRAAAKGAQFAQVICAEGDHKKSEMLRKLEFKLGHRWFVRSS